VCVAVCFVAESTTRRSTLQRTLRSSSAHTATHTSIFLFAHCNAHFDLPLRRLVYYMYILIVCCCVCIVYCVLLHVSLCVAARVYADSLETRTEWRRPIGCLKLQVSFRKTAANYRALLQKMTYKDKASYGSSPPSSVPHTCTPSSRGAQHNMCTPKKLICVPKNVRVYFVSHKCKCIIVIRVCIYVLVCVCMCWCVYVLGRERRVDSLMYALFPSVENT